MPNLNIDYAAIIEKADQRRATLQKIESLLANTPEHMEDLLRVNWHLRELAALHQSLDLEGRNLLGPVGTAIYRAQQYLDTAVTNLGGGTNVTGMQGKSYLNTLLDN